MIENKLVQTLAPKLEKLFARLTELVWMPILLARVSEGYMFASSGWGKLHHLEKFVNEFRSLGIPAPSLQAPLVATLELVGGTALILGLGSRVFAAMLSGTMVVALLTARLKEPGAANPSNLFYLSEWLLFVVLVWIVFAGPGKASLDHLLKRKLTKRD